MVVPDRPEPRFAVSVDDVVLEEDLAHATAAGRAAIAPVIEELRRSGVPCSYLTRLSISCMRRHSHVLHDLR
jgi:hypothetical protein